MIHRLQGNTLELSIKLRSLIYRSENRIMDDFLPLPEDVYSVRLIGDRSFSFVPTLDVETSDAPLLIVRDDGTLPAGVYDVEVRVSRADGKSLRSFLPRALELLYASHPHFEDCPLEGNSIELVAAPFVFGRGESAYEVAVRNGYVGTIDEWLKSLKADATHLVEAEETRAKGVEKGLNESLYNNQVAITQLQSTLVERLNTESETRAAADTALSARIDGLNIRNLGVVANSSFAENEAANAMVSAPTLFLYTCTNNGQGGVLLSQPADLGSYGGWYQRLLLSSTTYVRGVLKGEDGSIAQTGAWTKTDAASMDLSPTKDILYLRDANGTVLSSVELNLGNIDNLDNRLTEAEAKIPTRSGRNEMQMTLLNSAGDTLFTLPYATDTMAGVITAANRRALYDTETRSKQNQQEIEDIKDRTDDKFKELDDKDAELDDTIQQLESRVISEETRAKSAEASVEGLARGTTNDAAYTTTMKCVTYGSTGDLLNRVNQLLLDGHSRDVHGLYQFRYAHTGGVFMLFEGGLNEDDYPTNGSRGVTQMVVGNVGVNANPDVSGTGTTWAEAGVPNALQVEYGSMKILCRRLYYNAGVRVITPWVEYVQYYAGIQTANRYALTNLVMRDFYVRGNYNGGLAERRPSYDENTGLWSLNGLTDITPLQMEAIYAETHCHIGDNAMGLCRGTSCRTNLPWGFRSVGYNYSVPKSGMEFRADCMFDGNSTIEVVEFCVSDYAAQFTSYRYMFRNCTSLRSVGRMDLSRCDAVNDVGNSIMGMFQYCTALVDVKIEGLKISGLNFAQSPNLSAESVIYLLEHVENEKAISVVVHADVLAKIQQGADDWHPVLDLATEKNVSFVSG